jgi:hypothetical protein
MGLFALPVILQVTNSKLVLISLETEDGANIDFALTYLLSACTPGLKFQGKKINFL